MIDVHRWPQDGTSEFLDELGNWIIAYTVRRNPDGTLGIERLTIRPNYKSVQESLQGSIPDGGITSALLRRIQVGAHLRYARDLIRRQRPEPPGRQKTVQRGRPKVIPRARRRKILREYRALLSARGPHPVKTLAARYGYKRPAMSKLLKRLGTEDLE